MAKIQSSYTTAVNSFLSSDILLPILQYDSIISEFGVRVLAYPKVTLNRIKIEKDKQDIVNIFKSKQWLKLIHFIIK